MKFDFMKKISNKQEILTIIVLKKNININKSMYNEQKHKALDSSSLLYITVDVQTLDSFFH